MAVETAVNFKWKLINLIGIYVIKFLDSLVDKKVVDASRNLPTCKL